MTKEKVKDVVENRDNGTEKESDNMETRLLASKKQLLGDFGDKNVY